jgi:hypothetical protein
MRIKKSIFVSSLEQLEFMAEAKIIKTKKGNVGGKIKFIKFYHFDIFVYASLHRSVPGNRRHKSCLLVFFLILLTFIVSVLANN